MYGFFIRIANYDFYPYLSVVVRFIVGDANSEIGLLVKEKQIGFVFEPGDRVGVTNFLASLSDDMIPVIKQMGIRAREVAEKEYAKGIILDKFSKAI